MAEGKDLITVSRGELDNIKTYVRSVEDGLRVLENLRVGLAEALNSAGVGEPYRQELIGMNWVLSQVFDLIDTADNGLNTLMKVGGERNG